jgi:glycosyltransferase involved in cell wall biosynthesis
MRIAQISPLVESVPPRLYGGSERVVSFLTEALVEMGHEVTLFASGDSVTSAKLMPCVPEALRLNPSVRDHLPYYMVMLKTVREMASKFDILHFHLDNIHFPVFAGALAGRTVTTLHSRQDQRDLEVLYRGFPHMALVSISDAQRQPVPYANFAATVPHGLPRDLLPMIAQPSGGYLAFLGRISPEKRLDRAIAIARAAGLPLKVAAKIDRADEAYFRSEIAPLLTHPGVEFVGEINERQKATFLGNARGLLFPIDWPEPFGLVMIEAMACGTPVLAFRQGSVPEVVDHGITGFIVDDVAQAVRCVGPLLALDRRQVRERFEQRFTADRMARSYVRIYQEVVGRGARRHLSIVPRAADVDADRALH